MALNPKLMPNQISPIDHWSAVAPFASYPAGCGNPFLEQVVSSAAEYGGGAFLSWVDEAGGDPGETLEPERDQGHPTKNLRFLFCFVLPFHRRT